MKKDEYVSKLVDSSERSSREFSGHLLEIAALYELSRSVNAGVNLEEIIEGSGTLFKKNLGIDDFCIMLLEKDGLVLKLVKSNSTMYSPAEGFSIKVGEGVSGLAAEKGNSVLVQDVTKDKRFLHYNGKSKGTGALLSIPLKDRQGKVMGVFNIHRHKADSFEPNDVLFFEAGARHVASAIEKALIFREMETQAIMDDLTGLYSRRYFVTTMEKTLSNTLRTSKPFGLLIIDVDNFKLVNDHFGHPAGDRVLKSLGTLMNDNIRKGDLAARYGGEEFVILLAEGGLEEAMFTAEKLRSRVEKSIFVGRGKKRRPVTISIGVSIFPQCGLSVAELISSADRALYLAKCSGRNQVRSYSEAEEPHPAEKRKSRRFMLTLVPVYTPRGGIQYIDLKINGRWTPCVIEDVSNSGFKGKVSSKLSPGETIPAKVHTMGGKEEFKSLSFLCRAAKELGDANYSVGMEVLGDISAWRQCLTKIGV